MNPVAEEMRHILEDEDYVMHYGMPRRSGRYPWGSGKDPYQRSNRDFLGRIEELKKQGWSETPENIKKEFGISVKQYRTKKMNAVNDRRLYNIQTAKSLKEDGLNPTEIGREMGVRESTVRNWLDPKTEERAALVSQTADFLLERSKELGEKGMLDVGDSAHLELRVSRERFDAALQMLQDRDGYHVYPGRVEQPTNPGNFTTQKVLCPPGVPYSDIYNRLDDIHTIKEYISRDGGETFEKKFTYPSSLDSKRMMVRYKEDGGEDKDGIVELRRGVDDLSLGEKRYSQVRILVDGTHYIKGMAVYSDDMPDGVDVIFNTNKSSDVPMLGPKNNTVLKPIKNDPENPFGSLIKDVEQGGQYWYTDKTTGEKKLGLINKRSDEGDWTDWQDALPSQFLAKQSKSMAQKQLDIAKADKQAEFDDICSLENPTIKKHLLNKFADECDAAAVNLKAAALPGQKYHVIVPINTLKDTEVYAPRYEDGTKLALIRYPHGGTFEIPILTVNNKNADARKILGTDALDAIGITKKNADRLSGADFDGDTVMTIPTHDKSGRVKIVSTDELRGLKGFDPKLEYPEREGMQYMKDTQKQMGVISNLITDMTLAGATPDELARAVRHSMVVIDAEKHNLDYKRSEIENNIAALKKAYQVKEVDADGNPVDYGGASTLISRAKGQYSVDKRQGSGYTNIKDDDGYDPSRPEGALIYKTADPDKLYKPVYTTNKKKGVRTYTTEDGQKITLPVELKDGKYVLADTEETRRYKPIKQYNKETGEVKYTNKDGDITYAIEKRTQKSTNMAETDNAYSLVSTARHPMELIYADYANSMKAMANKARLTLASTSDIKVNPNAKQVYKAEVDSLMSKLNDALKNRVRERAAMRQATVQAQKRIKGNNDIKPGDVKKINAQEMSKARADVGAIARSKRHITITDREWEAIQAGAIAASKLKNILDNTDIAELRERATPRTSKTNLSQGKINQIKAMSASYTIAEIAEKLNLSTSTVAKHL